VIITVPSGRPFSVSVARVNTGMYIEMVYKKPDRPYAIVTNRAEGEVPAGGANILRLHTADCAIAIIQIINCSYIGASANESHQQRSRTASRAPIGLYPGGVLISP
jgi:hypothetical protein